MKADLQNILEKITLDKSVMQVILHDKASNLYYELKGDYIKQSKVDANHFYVVRSGYFQTEFDAENVTFLKKCQKQELVTVFVNDNVKGCFLANVRKDIQTKTTGYYYYKRAKR